MKKSNLFMRAAAMLLFAVLGSTGAWARGGTSNQIVVVSDIHVMAPSLLEEGAETKEAWTTYYAGERKMLQQSAAIFDQFVDQMIVLRPRVVLIAGDLTKDGESDSHTYVRNGLDLMRDNGIKVLVIPGNHDFGAEGNHTIFKADGTKDNAEVISVDGFESLYYNYGYNEWDNERDPNSLSYVAEPMEGLVVLAIDSHTASISEATLTWLCTKATAERNAGKQVIAMMHHPLFPHITGANMFIDTYTVTKDGGTYEDVRNALIEAGVNTILTGHFHTSDIAKDWNDDEGKAVYDINTGSLISYPCDYRILTPSQDFMTLDVATESIVPTGMTAEDCKAWLKDRMTGLVKGELTSYSEPIKSVMAGLVADAYIIHAEGDEQNSTSATKATILAAAENYPAYAATFHSMLEDKSNYGTEKENQTADRTLSITLPEVGPFVSTEPGIVTIGEGSTSRGSGYLPSDPNNNYSMSQQIYTKDEIGKKGKITSIAFYNYDTGSERNCDFYLTHTSKTSFDNSTDWVTVAVSDKVFSGTVKFDQSKWTVVELDKPFEYDGRQNLLLTVDDNTGKSTGYNYNIQSFEASYSQVLCYYSYGIPANLDPTQAISIEGKVQSRKNKVQLCFETNPKPYNVKALEVGDVSAQIQCSLREGTEKWNLRYRKAVAEGEQENEWTVVNNLTERSKTIEGLTAFTKYEAQVQAFYGEGALSDWTDPVIFVTNCCPVGQQAEIIYAFNSNYENYYGYAVQFMDVTDEKKPIEVAYINPPGYGLYSGTLTLCCGHKYKVNWMFDEEHPNLYESYSFSLFFEPGDLIYSMARGEAPNKNAELTEFIMDCTPYCAPKPKNFTITGTTHDSATMTFVSNTKTGEVVYSTDENFDPDAITPTSVNFDAVVNNNEFDPNPANASMTLNGLESLTAYYVRVRSLCTEGVGHSRWSDPIRVITNSKYARPSRVTASPVDSKTEDTAWKRIGKEGKNNVNYRTHGASTPAGDPILIDLDGDDETFSSWGGTAYGSEGKKGVDNVIAVANVPAKAMVSWNAADGNSAKIGGNTVRFQYGFVKQTKKYGDSDEEIAAARAALDGALKSLKQQEEEEQAQPDYLDNKLEQAKALEARIALEELEYSDLDPNSNEAKEKREEILQLQTELDGLQGSLDQTGSTEGIEALQAVLKEVSGGASEARMVRRALSSGEEYYFFYIRHTEPDETLLVKDITITPAENIGDWITIPNVKNVEYTLQGLQPNTQYEVMVEPVYDSGLVGLASPITVFKTIGAEADPMEGEFSVSVAKKVQFAKGNLRYEGDNYGMEATWSMAPQQYEIIGESNVKVSGDNTYPASPRDLFCWSNTDTRYGIYNYYNSEEDTQQYFQGDFTDWCTNPKFTAALGAGWSTLNKEEWTYLLTGRKNATTLKAFATVNNVKGLVLLPDEWNAPDGILLKDVMTAEEWAAIEQTGVVFLPAAGQMTAVYNPGTYGATTTFTEAGSYWTSTPSGDKSDLKAFALTFTDSEVSTDADILRRTYTAVRLVKAAVVKGDTNGNGYVDEDDFKAVLYYILGRTAAVPANADLDGNGVVDIADLARMIPKMKKNE